MKQLLSVLLLTGCVSALFAQNADVMKSDAIMQESQMQYLAAAELYEKAAQLYESDGHTDAFSWFKAGQNYAKAKAYQKAVTMLDKAQTSGYSEAELYLSMGDAFAGTKQFDKAEKALIDGRNQFASQKAEFTKKLGYLYFNSEQYEKAVTSLSEAISEEPGNYMYHYLLGSSYERLKDYAKATEELEKVVALQPNHLNSIKKLGVIYFKQTDHLYSKETKRYEAMKNPSRVDYHNSTKKLEEIAKGYNKALPYLEQAHQLSSKDKAIISCLSIAYRRLKMEDKASQMAALLK
ncbi:tetratricopeptide repeat protein [Carboxylicivirga sediminis]|uniref:Tetratricopeptide repeat protein n=1 Tax=Carboxylicivirga sediminis TaxID=2006564 RepID=A0A941F4D4_9BACT|nr:tetratricopeptide repeat protein [Carboxylicivirga sediminis]MBR8535759.1 tetratricopeptide repeat protein [Carboxylicivirga sediminis]